MRSHRWELIVFAIVVVGSLLVVWMTTPHRPDPEDAERDHAATKRSE